MSFVTWKVERNEFLGTSWSGTTTEITDFSDIMISVAAGEKKDSFSFKLDNAQNRWNNYFKPNDLITISRVANSATVSTNDIKMVGVIRNLPNQSSGKQDMFRIEGYNFSESVVTSIVFYDSNNVELTPLQLLKGAIDWLALQNDNFKITWDTNNPLLTKKDGVTSFPTYAKKWFYVPLSKIIDEMLSPSATLDGQYIWWVDKDRKFIVRSSIGGANYSYNIDTDTDTIQYKDSKDTSQVKNFIILKGGTDASNKPIQIVKRDYESIVRHGLKYFFGISKTTVSQNLNKLDLDSIGDTGEDRYPTFPFTTTWAASYTATVEGINVVKGSTVYIASGVNANKQYNAILRKEIETQLRAEAEEIINNTRFGKLKIDITTRAGSKPWVLGDKITCTIPKLGTAPKELRVREIQYTTQTDTYSLEEDTGTI